VTGADGDGAAALADAPLSVADRAQLALLYEVSGTPKPGNVDRRRDLPELRFESFLAGAVGARPGLVAAADPDGPGVGAAFERAVAGMSRRAPNTQFGCLLLLAPLVRAAARDDLSPAGVRRVVRETTVDDAAAFYRAFDHVDVAVPDLPPEADALDVRRGSDAVPDLRERGTTLADVMADAAREDGAADANAREWAEGFPRTFAASEAVRDGEGPPGDRASRAFVDLLSAEPDTLVATNHGPAVALEVRERAAGVDGPEETETLADALVAEGINPGTTADLTCAALFVALERGVEG
jgi:triphosphoribosyl-dephospho-CoA synthase